MKNIFKIIKGWFFKPEPTHISLGAPKEIGSLFQRYIEIETKLYTFRKGMFEIPYVPTGYFLTVDIEPQLLRLNEDSDYKKEEALLYPDGLRDPKRSNSLAVAVGYNQKTRMVQFDSNLNDEVSFIKEGAFRVTPTVDAETHDVLGFTLKVLEE